MLPRGDLDTFDQKIVRELRMNGRLSWRELAQCVGLSLSPTIRRVKRLEEAGVIRGYHAALDESRLRGAIGVFVNVALERQIKAVLAEFEAQVVRIPEIVGAYQVSGNSDYLIHATVRDLEHYQKLLESISAISNVSKIESKFVVKSVIHRPTAAPDGLQLEEA